MFVTKCFRCYHKQVIRQRTKDLLLQVQHTINLILKTGSGDRIDGFLLFLNKVWSHDWIGKMKGNVFAIKLHLFFSRLLSKLCCLLPEMCLIDITTASIYRTQYSNQITNYISATQYSYCEISTFISRPSFYSGDKILHFWKMNIIKLCVVRNL